MSVAGIAKLKPSCVMNLGPLDYSASLIHSLIDKESPGTERYWELIEALNTRQTVLDKHFPEQVQVLYETNCIGQQVRPVSYLEK